MGFWIGIFIGLLVAGVVAIVYETNALEDWIDTRSKKEDDIAADDLWENGGK